MSEDWTRVDTVRGLGARTRGVASVAALMVLFQVLCLGLSLGFCPGLGYAQDEGGTKEQENSEKTSEEASQDDKQDDKSVKEEEAKEGDETKEGEEAEGDEEPPPSVQLRARFELVDQVFNKDGLSARVRYVLENPVESERTFEVDGSFLRGVGLVIDHGEDFSTSLSFREAGLEPERVQTIDLSPGAFVGVTLDLQPLLNTIEPGRIRVTWSGEGLPPTVPHEPMLLPDPRRVLARISTDFGDLELRFLESDSPMRLALAHGTVNNFMKLVLEGYYNQTTFHRVYKGFIIQGGDHTGTGRGGPNYKIRAEFNKTKHRKGIVSMARLPSDPNSAGSQFFIVHGRYIKELDGRYAAFARVVKGLDVLDRIANVPVEVGADSRGERSSPITPVYIRSITLESLEESESEEAEGESGEADTESADDSEPDDPKKVDVEKSKADQESSGDKEGGE